MNLLQQAILRSKLASQTPKAVIMRPQPAPVLPKPIQTIPIRSLEDEHLELVRRHHEVWRQNEEYRRIIAVINVRQTDAVTGLSIKTIQTHVAAAFEVGLHEMLSERRSRGITFPRHVAMYLCHVMTGASYPRIGRGFSRRDHTTVMYGVRKIQHMLSVDAELSAVVAEIKGTIEKSLHDPGGHHEPQCPIA